LVARVGRTAPDKVIGVGKGGVAYTDCLYRIRVPAEWRQCVLANLTSAAGRAWLEQHGYGVAARQLTRSDLLNLPLVLS
jgi:type I restriction enzyme M protein